MPSRRPISRPEIPAPYLNRKTSRTWRIDTLSAGIPSTPKPKPKERTLSGQRRRYEHPCPGRLIPERWAASNRNGGRHHPGTPGDIKSERWAASPGIINLEHRIVVGRGESDGERGAAGRDLHRIE